MFVDIHRSPQNDQQIEGIHQRKRLAEKQPSAGDAVSAVRGPPADFRRTLEWDVLEIMESYHGITLADNPGRCSVVTAGAVHSRGRGACEDASVFFAVTTDICMTLPVFEHPARGVADEFAPIAEIQFQFDILAIGVDRLPAQREPRGDLFRRESLPEHLEHEQLPV